MARLGTVRPPQAGPVVAAKPPFLEANGAVDQRGLIARRPASVIRSRATAIGFWQGFLFYRKTGLIFFY